MVKYMGLMKKKQNQNRNYSYFVFIHTPLNNTKNLSTLPVQQKKCYSLNNEISNRIAECLQNLPDGKC